MTEARPSTGAARTPGAARARFAAVARNQPVVVATAAAAGLGLLYLAAPPMGGDLAAQLARADFAGSHPFAGVDFRWFGGVLPFGYSLWTPPVMHLLGVRLTGTVATILSVAAFTALVSRRGAARPGLGGLLAAVTLTSNLAEGRVTFACGLAAALLALLALAAGPPDRRRRMAAGAAAVVAAAASPVAALLLLVAAAALVARRRLGDAAALFPALVPLAVTSLFFADGGRQVFNGTDALRALVASGLVVALVPRSQPTLRIGAAIGLIMVAAAFVLPTPVGGNATRLSLLFAVPIVAAFAPLSRRLVAVAIVTVTVVQTPVTLGTLAGAGRPVTHAGYYQPLLDQLAARGPLSGRIEVPELTGHWDAAYLARAAPLARGWLRQADTRLNDDVFYRDPPNAASYRTFLDRNAVQYVAVPDARRTFYGRRETALIAAGLSYLRPLWHGRHWTLYVVADAVPVVAQPARLLSYGAAVISLWAPAGADIAVRMRWFSRLRVSGPDGRGCLQRGGNQVVVVRTTVAGVYRISSTVAGRGSTC